MADAVMPGVILTRVEIESVKEEERPPQPHAQARPARFRHGLTDNDACG